MQALNTHNSAAKINHARRHWWHVRVVCVCTLVLMVFTFIIALQANMGQSASRVSNDPPWPAPTGTHIVASSISYGE
ncbi:MAG: hypothetical protein ACRDHZ_13390 [Ktedonobacteraceae bacterium]